MVSLLRTDFSCYAVAGRLTNSRDNLPNWAYLASLRNSSEVRRAVSSPRNVDSLEAELSGTMIHERARMTVPSPKRALERSAFSYRLGLLDQRYREFLRDIGEVVMPQEIEVSTRS